MVRVRASVFWAMSMLTWALALYLFYEGDLGGGVLSMVSSVFLSWLQAPMTVWVKFEGGSPTKEEFQELIEAGVKRSRGERLG